MTSLKQVSELGLFERAVHVLGVWACTPGSEAAFACDFGQLHPCCTMACKVPQILFTSTHMTVIFPRPYQDPQEAQDRCRDALFFLPEEEREVRGHMGHPSSMHQGGSGTISGLGDLPPPGPPTPIRQL